MLTTTTCIDCPAPALAASSRTRLRADLLARLGRAWTAWRAARDQRRRLRALAGLSPGTLRDIGVADLMPPEQPTLSQVDYERGMW